MILGMHISSLLCQIGCGCALNETEESEKL